MDWLPVALVTALAMGFNYTNGFHDAANAIATSVSTRALTPRAALAMAVGCLAGGWCGPPVVKRVPPGPLRIVVGVCGLGLAAWLAVS